MLFNIAIDNYCQYQTGYDNVKKTVAVSVVGDIPQKKLNRSPNGQAFIHLLFEFSIILINNICFY